MENEMKTQSAADVALVQARDTLASAVEMLDAEGRLSAATFLHDEVLLRLSAVVDEVVAGDRLEAQLSR